MKLVQWFIFCLLVSGSIETQASLYEAKRAFLPSDEEAYSEWIKESVQQDIFSNPNSPYYGIKLDCADAAFALRVIFAYENKLSFEFIENKGKKITEKTSRFDHVSSDALERLKVLIDYIGENAGSEILASDNTYPIDLRAIRSGDLYITKWTNAKGEFTRHVYIVKDILPTGDLLLFSATQPRAVRPFLARKGMPLRIFKGSPYGFRRFKANSKTPLENYSTMQYEALKLGADKFFSLVKEGLKKTDDTLDLNVERRIENICVAMTIRQDIVEMALQEKLNQNGRCFSKAQYDELSTPSRDRNIIQDIERLKNGYKTIVKNGLTTELKETTKIGLDYLISEDVSDEALNALKKLCSIRIELSNDRNIVMTIKSFFDRYKAGLISSNPNESLGARWGLASKGSGCREL